MPSQKAVLRDLADHGLDPHKAHRRTTAGGRLAVPPEAKPVELRSGIVKMQADLEPQLKVEKNDEAPKVEPSKVEEKTVVEPVKAEEAPVEKPVEKPVADKPEKPARGRFEKKEAAKPVTPVAEAPKSEEPEKA
jgi:hypothetical protein